MKKLYKLKPIWVFLIFIFIDTLFVGMGMGVPVFSILFGFVVGWFIISMITPSIKDTQHILEKTIKYSMVTSGFTFLLMLIIWGPTILLLFDPNFNFENFGMPLILFQPKTSFIGWLVLMIFISPFLQLLTTIFSSTFSYLLWIRKNVAQG